MIDHDDFMRELNEKLQAFSGRQYDEVVVKQMEIAATRFIQSFEPSVAFTSFDEKNGTANFTLQWQKKGC